MANRQRRRSEPAIVTQARRRNESIGAMQGRRRSENVDLTLDRHSSETLGAVKWRKVVRSMPGNDSNGQVSFSTILKQARVS